MNQTLKFRPVALTILTLLTVSYILCILAGLLFNWTMYEAWLPLLPGTAWPITISGFAVGLIWMAVYSLYGAALIVYPYNHLAHSKQS
jgi:hypothetical protein